MVNGLSLTITLAFLFFVPPCAFGDNPSIGFLYDHFPLTLESGHRTEILGPFYYDEQNDSGNTVAYPPFYSCYTDPSIDTFEINSLYPLFTYIKYGTQYRAQFFQLLSLAGGADPDQLVRHRATVYPIFFMQRSADSNDNYTAVAPFYGHMENHLFHDKIFFVMFPAYSQTWKQDVVNYNYLYPFVNVRHGNGMHGWQFWPFYGQEHKTLTLMTNHWGNVETNGGHDQYFVLWPIHFWQNNGIGTDNPEKLRIDLPFYTLSRSPNRDSTCVLWPFFNWIDDRQNKYREKEMPWPFVVVAHGSGKTALRIFPFYEHAYNKVFQDNFYLWPIYKYNSIYSPPLDRRRARIVFFLYQNTLERNTATGKSKRRVDFWPFLLYTRNFDGGSRLQVPALAETFFPASPGIDRNWSPLWSVWRSERNPGTGAASQSVLWNFYRRDAAPDTRKISFFFGLYQYQYRHGMESVRLFYFPIIHRHSH